MTNLSTFLTQARQACCAEPSDERLHEIADFVATDIDDLVKAEFDLTDDEDDADRIARVHVDAHELILRRLERVRHDARLSLPAALAIIDTLSNAIKHMQSMAGHPDAAEGCRLIIKQGNEAIAQAEQLAAEALELIK